MQNNNKTIEITTKSKLIEKIKIFWNYLYLSKELDNAVFEYDRDTKHDQDLDEAQKIKLNLWVKNKLV